MPSKSASIVHHEVVTMFTLLVKILLLMTHLAASRPEATLCVTLKESAVESTELLLTIENCSEEYVVLSPDLLPDEGTGGPDPWTRVRLSVESNDGTQLRWKGSDYMLRRKLPRGSDYLVLKPGYLIGRRFSLVDGPFTYDIGKESRLRITAEVTSTARTWLRIRSTMHRDVLSDVAFDTEQIFEGSARSNMILVTCPDTFTTLHGHCCPRY